MSAPTDPIPAEPGAAGAVSRRAWQRAATGVGSLPGTSADEAARTVAGELPDLPHVAELPDRGVGADLAGRATGLLVDIFAEVVPSGWRISRRPGRDAQRTKDLMAWDLDAAQQHYAGAEWVKTQVCGPVTLAALLELPSGNRALTDAGAIDDLAASLAEGVAAHVAELRARVPGAGIVVQLDEPAIPAALAGTLSTASGFGTVAALDAARAGAVLETVLAGIPDSPTVAHCCHPDLPIALFRSAGFDAVSLDVTAVGTAAARLDPIGEAVEAGTVLLAGLVASTDPAPHASAGTSAGPAGTLRGWARPILRLWDHLGLDRVGLASGVVPTPTCGLAGATPEWARRAMALSQELARAFEDLPEGW